LNDFQLLEFLYQSSKICNKTNLIISELYLKYLIDIEQYEESSKILETLDRNSHYFFLLENNFLKQSGNWKYLDNFYTSITQNSNVNNGFTSNAIDIYGMTFEVSDDAYPINDIGISYSYSGTLYRYFNRNTQLRLRAYVSGEDYSGSLADSYSPFFSSDYIYTKRDMISVTGGRSYWSGEEVYSLKSFSYTRKLTSAGNLKMMRFSAGDSKSPLNKMNSSRFTSVKGFFSTKKNFYINLEYTKNNTDFKSSTYSGYSLSTYKEFNIFSTYMIPYVELEKRSYDGVWTAYEKKRSYLKKNFGMTITSDKFKKLKIKLSTNRFNSNIAIYDNRVNLLEFEYSFF